MSGTQELKAILFDVDGSVAPQGGSVSPEVASIFRGLKEIGLKMGPATGKNADYCRGMAMGLSIGTWSFVIAETGAQFIETTHEGPPPAFRFHRMASETKDLALFRQLIRLDAFERTFLLRKTIQNYRPEMKEEIISIFPADEHVERTKGWLDFFNEVVKIYDLNLTLKRHSDGCIDIIPAGVTKQLGVNKVCQLIGCIPKQILTVADGVNDEELVTGTTPIAVANAVPRIKELALAEGGFVADFNDGKGFAQGLLHFARKGMWGEEVGAKIVGLTTAVFPEFESLG